MLALDADPQMNLPYALGMPPERGPRLVPLSQQPDYVEEKTGARPGRGLGRLFCASTPTSPTWSSASASPGPTACACW